MSEAIRHFELIQRFRAVLILDADSRLDKEYLQRALHCFSDREVVAVAGFATTEWPGREESLWARFLIAYRERVYVLTQYLQKYGQTWKRTNVAYIVPGYASMYRSRALERIDIAAPGLIIEDFNMTFELQHKGLGRVAFHPNIVGYTQDPNTFRDYVRQVKRWQLGFWQTIRRHRFWPSTFCAALVLNIVELIVASVFLLVLPIGLALAALHQTVGVPGALDSAGATAANIFEPTRVLLLVFLPDYLMSCAVAIVRRRPSYLLFGLAFLPMRLVDAAIVMWAVPAAFFTKSTGSWVSPTRR